MKYTDVMIRRKTDVDMLDPRIKEAFVNASKERKTISVFYQELQNTSGPALIDDQDACFGVASNIHENIDGDYVCTIITNDALAITENFQGVIDNFIIKVELGNKPAIVQFVVYNKDKKAAIDHRLKERMSTGPRYGSVALPSDITSKEVLDAVEEITAEFEEEKKHE